ncbi:MAG: hypothetical protein AMS16_05195 [Planctomycetes bacterium DG_58]|nr:MAG: hypothetical protein AMS16_05195 [Planctomycetes bacterium DG_58]
MESKDRRGDFGCVSISGTKPSLGEVGWAKDGTRRDCFRREERQARFSDEPRRLLHKDGPFLVEYRNTLLSRGESGRIQEVRRFFDSNTRTPTRTIDKFCAFVPIPTGTFGVQRLGGIKGGATSFKEVHGGAEPTSD